MIELAPNLHIVESTVRFYGVRLQTRMTVVTLDDGLLLLYSPTAPDPETMRQLDALGRVAYVVAPNKIHNQFIGPMLDAYPDAEAFACPGLPERRPDLRFARVLGDRPEPEWEAALDQVATGGNAFFSEVVLFHGESRQLIVADLVENLDRHTAGRVARGLARLFGVGRGPVASPEHRFYTDDPAAFEASVQRALEWDVEGIVLAHGALVRERGRDVLEAVCRELLEAVRRRPAAVSRMLSAISQLQ